MPESRILLGVIGRAHGVRGRARVASYTTDPETLTAYGPLSTDDGRRFLLEWCSEGVVEISEIVNGEPVRVRDRNTTEKLTGTALYIDRALLPEPEEEAFYFADLLGVTAVDEAGAMLGEIRVVHDYGAGASLEIANGDSPVLIVPFTRAAVPVVDIAAGRVTVIPPKAVTPVDAALKPIAVNDANDGRNDPWDPDRDAPQ